MTSVLAVLLAFAAGALPFSVWVGQFALGEDVRQIGDGNPGATNVLRLGGWRWFAAVGLLDFLKGAVPAGIVHVGLGWTGLSLILTALAPIAGHAFSPLLRFRGGKAVATTFGVWTGLTVWEGPTIFGMLLGVTFALVAASGWAVMLALAGLLAYFLLTPDSVNLLGLRPAPATIVAVWSGNALLLAWKHRAELAHRPHLRQRSADRVDRKAT